MHRRYHGAAMDLSRRPRRAGGHDQRPGRWPRVTNSDAARVVPDVISPRSTIAGTFRQGQPRGFPDSKPSSGSPILAVSNGTGVAGIHPASGIREIARQAYDRGPRSSTTMDASLIVTSARFAVLTFSTAVITSVAGMSSEFE